MWFAPLPLTAVSKHAIAITLFMILAWAFEVLDHGLVGLIGCYLFWALKVVKVDVAFSGFADDTAWFVLGAMPSESWPRVRDWRAGSPTR